MELIKLQVEKQNIVSDRQYLVSDTENVYQVEYTFDNEWQGYTKFGVFKQNNIIKQVLLVDDKCQFPNEAITEQGYVAIGVYGVNGDKRYPTIFTSPILVQLGVMEGTQPTPPTPTEWEQIITELSRLEDSIDVLETDVESLNSQVETLNHITDDIETDIETINTNIGILNVNKANVSYVDEEIARVEAEIPSTDDFATKEELQEVENQIPTKTSDLTNDSGFITNSALSGYATETYVNNHHDSTKQDVITDLATIRSGASLGATALQEVPSTYRTSANQDIIDNEIKGDIETLDGRLDTAESDIDTLETSKEDVSNKKSVLSSSTTEYPNNYAVNNAIEDVREVAEGKTATYVVDSEVETAFASDNASITISNTFVDINGVTHNVADLKVGDNIYVSQLSVFDRWVASISGNTATLYKLETAKVPVHDVQINGTTIVNNNVANIPLGTENAVGVLKGGTSYGANANGAGEIFARVVNYPTYQGRSDSYFISKGTLENVITGKQLQNATQVDTKIGNRNRKNITTNLTNLSQAIAEQNLEKYGYAIGDYFVGASGYYYYLADMDTNYGGYNNQAVVSTHHCGIVVDTKSTCQWLSSGNVSSYSTSTLHTFLSGTALTNIKNDITALFGGWSNHLLARNELDNSVGGWGTTWTGLANCLICAMTEVQMYGARVFGESGYQTGTGSKPLELFRKFRFNEIYGNISIWLKSVSSASNACIAYDDGYAYANGLTASRRASGLILFK